MNQKEAEKQKRLPEQELREIVKRKEQLLLVESKLYMKYRMGELSKEGYLEKKAQCGQDKIALEEREREIQEETQCLEQKVEKTDRFLRGLWKYKDGDELDAQLIHCFIKKIIVHDITHGKKGVEVIFHFSREELKGAEK